MKAVRLQNLGETSVKLNKRVNLKRDNKEIAMNKMLKNKHAGFSLVELGIVMLIIGVLAVGVLKGRELIENSRITASVAQIQEIDLAFSKFWDKYQAIPGDMTNPATRLDDCVGQCAFAGDGNNRIEGAPGRVQNINSEQVSAWAQLSASGFYEGTSINATAIQIGESHPEFPLGGGLRVGYSSGGTIWPTQTSANVWPVGHAMTTGNNMSVSQGAPNSRLYSPNSAYRIDLKLDDGMVNTGKIQGIGTNDGSATACATGDTDTDEYNASEKGFNCNLFIQINPF